jgi:DNA-directed RNA polymerase specialized sigma24 family protein
MNTENTEISAAPPTFEFVASSQMDALYAYAHWMTGSAEDSSFLLREAYGETHRWQKIAPPEADVRLHLFQSLRNSLLRLREERATSSHSGLMARLEEPPTEQGDVPEASADALVEPVVSFLETIVRRAIRSMPEEYGSTLLLCEIDDLSHADVAAIMECAVVEVRRRILEAKKSLRGELARYLAVLGDITVRPAARSRAFSRS